MRMRRGAQVLALVVVLPALVAAGHARADSVFSAQALGELAPIADMRGRGMGGVSVAVADRWNVSRANPATLADVRGFVVHGEMLGERLSTADQSGEDYSAHATSFPWFRLGVEIDRVGTFGLGVAPYTIVDYEFESIDRSSGVPVVQSFTGDDALSVLTVSYARRVRPALDLGIDLDLPIGSYNDIYSTKFPPDNGYVNTTDSLVVNVDRSPILRLGAAGTVRRGLRVGGAVTFGRDIGIRSEIKGNVQDPRSVTDADLHLPASLLLGVAYDIDSRWRVAADIGRTWWGATELDLGDDPLLTRSNIETRDVTRFGIGAEYQRDRALETRNIWARMPWRGGYSYTPWYFRDGYGQEINEHVVSAGAGLPFADTFGMVQLAFELGFRGDREKNGASERFIRLGISLSARERVPVGRVIE
jgi:hypothetical protein